MKTKVLTRAMLGVAALAIAIPTVAQVTKARYGTFGIDLTAADKTVKPGDDFWTYANGAWAKRTPIPADKGGVGYGNILSDEAEANVRTILTDMAANPAAYGATGKQVGDFYASWMDEAGIEAKGTAPLKPYLAKIAAVNDLTGLQTLFATTGYTSPIDVGIIPNLADPTHYTVAVGQSGLGMPRDYYLLPGAKYEGFRTAYKAYIKQMQELAGIPDAGAKADAIFALETAMAKEQWSPEQSRDIAKLNDPETLAGLKAKAPEVDWALMLKTAGLDNTPTVLMTNNTALTAMGKIMVATPLQTWKDYVAYHFVSDHATFLPKAFDDAQFGFYSKTLGGVQVKRDRWKRGVQLMNGALGEAVGQLYVKRYYPAASQAKMAELIENLRTAYHERISSAAWMDDATRKAALVKLQAFEPRIGHPDKYIDYSSLSVDRGDLLGNVMHSGEFQHQLELTRFAKPVDRTLWGMTPQTVNAYYNPLANQITFPAAILQPPYFDPNADPAVNYGAIGAIIGHEMGHGFDDQGSQFGPTGKFENWWTPEAKEAFKKRTSALSAQYDTYEPVPGTHIKGGLTLGENIGDLGGVEASYAAFQRYQAKHGKAPVIGGLTGDQRFFLAYAQAWQSKTREGAQRTQLLTDPHSPAKFRVNGIVRNVDAWYVAFNIKPGDALYLPPEKRVHIW
ncbi:MAG: endothelin-converting protein [Sphingomonas bacterium]|uniref:M13 family metallopeptidase n=1 Tax=Sphingomonas bacterium TaxID=1895847 RepID=UPI002616C148|nr:M13 family metallopeptidase [Sphingomonas bacterium]MDB5712309.1 endothelin-converting protein [Sphingomonas bacterium]